MDSIPPPPARCRADRAGPRHRPGPCGPGSVGARPTSRRPPAFRRGPRRARTDAATIRRDRRIGTDGTSRKSSVPVPSPSREGPDQPGSPRTGRSADHGRPFAVAGPPGQVSGRGAVDSGPPNRAGNRRHERCAGSSRLEAGAARRSCTAPVPSAGQRSKASWESRAGIMADAKVIDRGEKGSARATRAQETMSLPEPAASPLTPSFIRRWVGSMVDGTRGRPPRPFGRGASGVRVPSAPKEFRRRSSPGASGGDIR
jgi:hypothetical protein